MKIPRWKAPWAEPRYQRCLLEGSFSAVIDGLLWTLEGRRVGSPLHPAHRRLQFFRPWGWRRGLCENFVAKAVVWMEEAPKAGTYRSTGTQCDTENGVFRAEGYLPGVGGKPRRSCRVRPDWWIMKQLDGWVESLSAVDGGPLGFSPNSIASYSGKEIGLGSSNKSHNYSWYHGTAQGSGNLLWWDTGGGSGAIPSPYWAVGEAAWQPTWCQTTEKWVISTKKGVFGRRVATETSPVQSGSSVVIHPSHGTFLLWELGTRDPLVPSQGSWCCPDAG